MIVYTRVRLCARVCSVCYNKRIYSAIILTEIVLYLAFRVAQVFIPVDSVEFPSKITLEITIIIVYTYIRFIHHDLLNVVSAPRLQPSRILKIIVTTVDFSYEATCITVSIFHPNKDCFVSRVLISISLLCRFVIFFFIIT